MNPKTSNTLLTYSLGALPDPLQASPLDGDIVYGTLSFVVSNSGNIKVQLSQLQITLPEGDLAQQLTTNPGAILWATSPHDIWNVAMTSPGVFLLLPKTGRPIPVSSDGMVLQLYNIPINQQVGTVAIKVSELATNNSDPVQPRDAAFDVAKFPYGFYFDNLTAQVPMVQEGGTATLKWRGSDNATYTMQWNLSDKPVDVSEMRSWISPKLTSDTTFLLRAQVTSQKETVTRDLAVTVIVANPELQAKSLIVTGVSNLQGSATIGSDSGSQATVTGNFTVVGPTHLNGITTLKEPTTTGDLTVNGKLNSSSAATLNNVTINGTVAAFKGAQNVGEGTYSARTDGILIAYIEGPADLRLCYAWIHVTMPWRTYSLSGGNLGTDAGVYLGGNVMSIPMQQGQQCAIKFNYSHPSVLTNMNVVFIPLGTIPQSQEMLIKISDEVPAYEFPKPQAPRRPRAEAFADAFLKAAQSGEKKELVEFLKEYLTVQ